MKKRGLKMVAVDEDIHALVKIYCARNDLSIKIFCERAIEEKIRRDQDE